MLFQKTFPRSIRGRSIALVVGSAALLGLTALTSPANALSLPLIGTGTQAASASCIPSGSDVEINNALVGSGTVVTLCANSTFSLGSAITFTAPNQVLETQGLPTGATRAKLTVTGTTLATAINGNGQAGVIVENVQVDGARAALGAMSATGALLEMGGGGNNQIVRNIQAGDPRGWSVMHIAEGTVTNNVPACTGAQITNNTVGPSGTPNNAWADGISLACGSSTVTGNTIQDATDGGIVIFGAPGSLVSGNTIIAKTQTLLGGINLVDYAPTNGNYTGTRVQNNTISAEGALIKVGIAMGPAVWGCTSQINYGASVTDNTLTGAHMGYGYAVNGVSNFTVTGNVDRSQHTASSGDACGGHTSEPTGFQMQQNSGSTLQGDFVAGNITYVLAITEPPVGKVAILASANSEYVDAGATGSSPLIADSLTIGDAELFDVIKQSNHTFALRSRVNNLYVTTDDKGDQPLVASKTAVGPSELFLLVGQNNGAYGIQSAPSGLYVTAGSRGLNPLRATQPTVGGWEQFTLTPQ